MDDHVTLNFQNVIFNVLPYGKTVSQFRGENFESARRFFWKKSKKNIKIVFVLFWFLFKERERKKVSINQNKKIYILISIFFSEFN